MENDKAIIEFAGADQFLSCLGIPLARLETMETFMRIYVDESGLKAYALSRDHVIAGIFHLEKKDMENFILQGQGLRVVSAVFESKNLVKAIWAIGLSERKIAVELSLDSIRFAGFKIKTVQDPEFCFPAESKKFLDDFQETVEGLARVKFSASIWTLDRMAKGMDIFDDLFYLEGKDGQLVFKAAGDYGESMIEFPIEKRTLAFPLGQSCNGIYSIAILGKLFKACFEGSERSSVVIDSILEMRFGNACPMMLIEPVGQASKLVSILAPRVDSTTDEDGDD